MVFGQLTFGEAVVIGVILAPTDAALGQAVVTDARVSARVRQGLNVESGLNDGICVPLLFAAVALADVESHISGGRGAASSCSRRSATAWSAVSSAALVVAGILIQAGAGHLIAERWRQVIPAAAPPSPMASRADSTDRGSSPRLWLASSSARCSDATRPS